MTSDDATIIAAIIAAVVGAISVLASLYVARATVRGKLNELRQTQIGDVLQQRIAHYPSLWSLCQTNVTRPMFSECATQVHDGWASTLSDGLEAWHAEHGVFLSQRSYEALHRLRRVARIFAEISDTATAAKEILGAAAAKEILGAATAKEILGAAAAKGPLGALEQIWTSGFTEKVKTGKDKSYDGLATSLKNDLGSYAQAALSQ